MSAFIVSPSCMNGCVLAYWQYHCTKPVDRNPLRLTIEEGTRIGRELYAMNAEAVSQRYREPADLELALSYVFGQDHNGPRDLYTGCPHVDPIQQHKYLTCLLYQCHEGTVPDFPLYQHLAKVKAQVAEAIVVALPAWDRANWG